MLFFAMMLPALAATGWVPVQGTLVDAGGAPVEGPRPVTVRLFDDVDGDGTPTAFYTETATAHFVGGAFTLQLGGASGLDLTLLARPGALWLDLAVDGGAASDLVRIAHAPRAAWAESAPWTGLVGVPAGLADGDQDTTYAAGTGLTLTGTTFAVTSSALTPAWTSIQSRPSGLDDGDQDTTYAAGTGLTLTGTTFAVTSSALTPAWTSIQSRPSGLDDGDQDTTYTAGSGLALTGTQFSLSGSGAVLRQFGRYEGSGSSGGDGTAFDLLNQVRVRGSGLIRANQMTTSSKRNEFEALANCWFDFTVSITGNSSHGYSRVELTKAAGGSERLGLNYWHEGSTMGYSYSGSVYLAAGDKVQFIDDYTPTQPTGAWMYFTAESD